MSTPDSTFDDKYAVVGSWGESPYKDVTVPSGQTCLVKKIDMEDLVLLDLATDTDTPTGVAAQQVAKAQGHKGKQPTKAQALKAEQDKAAAIAKDPDAFKKHIGMISKVVCFAVQKPKIHPVPAPDPMQRVDGLYYVDSIDFADKMEIFKYAMSSTSAIAETFRKEQAADVGDVGDGEDVQLPSE